MTPWLGIRRRMAPQYANPSTIAGVEVLTGLVQLPAETTSTQSNELCSFFAYEIQRRKFARPASLHHSDINLEAQPAKVSRSR